jgi:four helix bundle protein
MAGITRFEEIEGWKTSRQLTNMIYKLTDQGAFTKDYGLKDQIRRAAVSTMSNIAEGFEGRQIHNLSISLDMLKDQQAKSVLSYIALDLKYISQEQFAQVYELADKSSRQITRFMNYLETNPRQHRSSEDSVDYNADV